MNKGLKALETIDRYVDKDYDYCQRGDYDEDYKVVEQELQRLESIENAKPGEALESLEKVKGYRTGGINSIEVYLEETKEYNTIKQTLIKAQEKEELLDYITKFIVNVEISDNGIYYISFRNSTPYLDCIEIDKDHYNKFKKIKESQSDFGR